MFMVSSGVFHLFLLSWLQTTLIQTFENIHSEIADA